MLGKTIHKVQSFVSVAAVKLVNTGLFCVRIDGAKTKVGRCLCDRLMIQVMEFPPRNYCVFLMNCQSCGYKY